MPFDDAGREQDRPVPRRRIRPQEWIRTRLQLSPALKAASITWDAHSLDDFLADPSADVHGTKMFITVPNAADRENVIAYLKTLK
jgi:cytochrome c2